MNHLRELLDLNPYDVGKDPHIDWANFESAWASTQVLATQAQCFWLGDVDRLGSMRVLPEIARLPFRTAWFEGAYLFGDEIGTPLLGIMATQLDDGLVNCAAYMKHNHRWALMWLVNDLDMQRGSFAASSNDPDVVVGVQAGIYSMRAFCCALNCSNVARESHSAPEKVQKKRIARGKAPLFSYWTLDVMGDDQRSGHLGGTHASPRVHLRRGHPRQYAPGKYTWVQPHAVGNKSLGMVHKDYDGSGLTGVPS